MPGLTKLQNKVKREAQKETRKEKRDKDPAAGGTRK